MSEFSRLNDLSLSHGLTLISNRPAGPLAPAARPQGMDAAEAMVIDERAGSRSDREVEEWLLAETEADPELLLPSAFNEAFDAARDNLRDWLVNDQGTQPDNSRTVRQCQRLLTEVRANLDLVHFYVNAIFKG